ncbi:hypothetical protein CLPU_28c00110 [Gottschalkia purinilytica]|uniref:Nucleotide modification associated domain-containing protein n=1 Tax=Gottschalkia purinilytica TaxID=1503 RepID=A0A0L0W6B3_GOTPU|nr:hypothetical protein [Gottschalkia purinilytica]KNF07059.1 hypothetical protein CLPU_28c00110 [Gottschalkia purinilytica]
MKVILSRKGFDSSSGGYPSPILPDGTLVSLPIPENNTDVYYKDLMIDDRLSYLDLIGQLGIKPFDLSYTTHLDPDLSQCTMKRTDNWKAIFGQYGSSAKHLDSENVDVGSIFLFFGWFRKTIKTNEGYKYDPKDKKGKHVIFGYLEVGEKFSIDKIKSYPDSYLNHPHFKNRNRKNNTAYIANHKLSFNNTVSGAGIFDFNEKLLLSYDSNKKSIWKLPTFFHPSYGTRMTYHENIKRWNLEDNFCTLNSVSRGQEFVIDGNDHVVGWAKNLILENAK